MESLYPVFVALVFNLLDLVTGFLSAVKLKDIKSSKLRDGLFKKIGFIVCYFVAWMLDEQGAYIGFSFGVPVLPVILLYACTTELVSIIENVSKINPDIIPEKLLDIFHVGKD